MVSLNTLQSEPYKGYVKKLSIEAGWSVEVYDVQAEQICLLEEYDGKYLVSGSSFLIALNYYGCTQLEWEAKNAQGASWYDAKPISGTELTIGFSKIWLFFQEDEAEVTLKVRLHDASSEDSLGEEHVIHLQLVKI